MTSKDQPDNHDSRRGVLPVWLGSPERRVSFAPQRPAIPPVRLRLSWFLIVLAVPLGMIALGFFAMALDESRTGSREQYVFWGYLTVAALPGVPTAIMLVGAYLLRRSRLNWPVADGDRVGNAG
jgi:hypothetical protein